MTMVGPCELHDPLATGSGAREPQGGHRRLGSRGGHAYHVHRLHPPRDLGGEVDLSCGGRAKASSPRGSSRYGFKHIG